MSTIICPNCRSSNVRRSHTRGFGERLWKLIGKKAFRCKDCGWRGLIYSTTRQNVAATKQQSYIFAIFLGIVVIVLILVFNLREQQIEKIARSILGKPK